MLPNARLEGMGESVLEAAPVPVKESTTWVFDWFEATANVTLPLKLPVAVGAKVMVAEADDPAWMVSGRARLLMENPAPLNGAWVMMRSDPPLFERVTGLVWLAPTLVLAKVRGEGLSERIPGVPVWFEPPPKPWQLVRSNKLPARMKEMPKRQSRE
jgi:hypothetical protein